MNAEPLLGALFGLALLAVVGRVLLAWLPSGEPGRHAPRALAHTWAASHFLGFVAFHTAVGAASELDLRLGWLAFVTPVAVLGALRLATLPAPLVPQHELRAAAPSAGGRASRWAFAAALVLLFVGAVSAGEHLWPTAPHELAGWRASRPWEAAVLRFVRPAHLAALALLVDHGLAPLGLAPALRRLAAFAAVLPAALSPELEGLAAASTAQDPSPGALARTAQLALTFGAGAALSVRWLLCADARSLALAGFAFAATLAEAPDGIALGLAGCAGLALVLCRPGLACVTWAGLAALAVALPWQLVRLALQLGACPPATEFALASSLGFDAAGLIAALVDVRAGGPFWLALPFLGLLALARAGEVQRDAARFLSVLALLAIFLQAPVAAAAGCWPALDAEWGEHLRRAAPAAAILGALSLALLTRASSR